MLHHDKLILWAMWGVGFVLGILWGIAITLTITG